MNRKLALPVIVPLLCALLGGCWNYQGMDTLDIVTGIAVDKEGDVFRLTFEIVDLASASKKSALKTKYIEAEGQTVFDAMRNVKRRMTNKLFLGNMQLLIVSHQLAESEGVFDMLESLWRDEEARETVSLAVSQQDSAGELLLSKSADVPILSYEINTIIGGDNRITASTQNTRMYQAYHSAKEPGASLVLPAVRCVESDGEQVIESNGVALFRDNRMLGYLSPAETKFYLFVMDKIEGGALVFDSGDGGSVSMKITDSKTKRSYAYEDGRLTICLRVKAEADLTEAGPGADLSDRAVRKRLEDKASEAIGEGIRQVIERARTEYGADVFSFGNMVYKRDPALWKRLADDWEAVFRAAGLTIEVQTRIRDSGILQNY